MQAQMAALAEKQAEQQARERLALQQQMLMEKQKEEQERLMLIQQKQDIVGMLCLIYRKKSKSTLAAMNIL